MKIGLKILTAAVAAVLAAGCGGSKGGGEDDTKYDGWMLVEWQGGTAMAGKVYLQLAQENAFVVYQSIDEPGFARFTGTYVIREVPGSEPVLSGTYTGGTPWDRSYAIEKYTKKELRIRALEDGIVSVYTGVEIPAYVKEGFTGRGSRAAVAEKPFL